VAWCPVSGSVTTRRRAVVPSHSYLALYRGGATLDPHADLEACEYTISLCIDATPDPQTHGAWGVLDRPALAHGAQPCGWLVQNCVQPVHNLGKAVDLNGELSLLQGCYLEERYLHLVHK
jgi:hypothetical protein